MALQHFYLTKQVLTQMQEELFLLDLTSEDLKHARVLRLNAGEHIAVIDSQSNYFECEVYSFTDEGLVVRIAEKLSLRPSPQITLIQGLAKGDKMDEIIRHATEVGVGKFIPLICERAVVRLDESRARKKLQRWCAIAKSAAMQAGVPRIPEVTKPLRLTEALHTCADYDLMLVFWEEAPLSARLRTALATFFEERIGYDCASLRIAVFVGPEGGLSVAEVDAMCAAHPQCHVLSLGSTILRTETAGVLAPALVRYELDNSMG